MASLLTNLPPTDTQNISYYYETFAKICSKDAFNNLLGFAEDSDEHCFPV